MLPHLSNVYAYPLVDKLAYIVAELDPETPGTTLAYVKTEAAVNTLAHNCRRKCRECW